MTLTEAIQRIEPAADSYRTRAKDRLDHLTKPVGSLGRLEELAADYAAMTREDMPKLPRAVIYTFAADHGVAAEGVSAYPAAVTAQMVFNFLRGGAAVNVLASHVGAEVRVVDIGVAYEFGPIPRLIARKVAAGTRNFAIEPAMTPEQAARSLEIGITLAEEAADEGVGLLGTGDMGIGNTTASAAITAILTRQGISSVTGRGTGIEETAWSRKVEVIEQAIARHAPKSTDVIDVLTKLGGFEIGGMAGLILGAAARQVPVILDGFIAGAAALVAVALQPRCQEYLFASHRSVECGHGAILQKLGLRPLLQLDMRLGEGTGACLGISLILASIKILTQMATFGEAGVSERTR
jgi:nicotinate-nucleotide--dimethylbenzimidazole phosphoribosyltransferase